MSRLGELYEVRKRNKDEVNAHHGTMAMSEGEFYGVDIVQYSNSRVCITKRLGGIFY